MTDLAKLVVRLEAETAKYQSELDKANRKLGKFERDVNDKMKRVGAAIGAAGALAAAGFAAMIKGSIDAADELAKLSRATGLTTEALSELQYVAGLSGVPDLDKSLNKFNKTIGDAASGLKTQADAFAALNVEIFDSQGNLRDTEAILDDTADAFAMYADGAAKSKVAQDLFGRSGAQLITFLNGGSKALREGREEARLFGVTVRHDAAEAAEQFNDNISRLRTSVSGLANQVAQDLSPALAGVTDDMVNLSKQNAAFSDVTGLSEWAGEAAYGLAVAAESVYVVLKSLRAVAGSFQAVAADIELAATFVLNGHIWGLAFEENRKELAAALQKRNRTVEESNQRYADLWNYNATAFSDSIRRRLDEATGYAQQIEDVVNAAIGIQHPLFNDEVNIPLRLGFTPGDKPQINIPKLTGVDDETVSVGKLDDELRELDDHARMVMASEEALRNEQERLRQQAELLTESLRTPNEIWEQQIEFIDRAYNSGYLTAETRTRALSQANRDLYQSLDALESNVVEAGNAISVYADQAARNMQNAFADFLFDPFEDGLDGMLKSFAQTMQRMVAEAAAAKIFESVGMAAGGSGANPVGAALSAFLGGLPGFANGGHVSAGEPVIVGETGRELFIPDVAGMIVPGGNSGGHTINVNINGMGRDGWNPITATQLKATIVRALDEAASRGSA